MKSLSLFIMFISGWVIFACLMTTPSNNSGFIMISMSILFSASQLSTILLKGQQQKSSD